MKPTLADYLLRERAEIFKHQETMQKLNGLFGELKDIFEAIDIEISNVEEENDGVRKEVATSTQYANAETPKIEDKLAAAAAAAARSRRPSQSTQATAADSQSSLPAFTSFLSRGYPQPPAAPQAEVTASRDELLSSPANHIQPARDVVVATRRDLLDDLVDGHSGQQRFQLTSGSSALHQQQHHHRRPTVTFAGPPPASRAKTDAYRHELLQQIEEKKRAKQAEVDRQRAVDDELEKRINEQRLTMYLQYLEERQKGDFIGAKANNKTTGEGPGTSEGGTTLQVSSNTTQQQQQQHASTDFSRLKLPSAAAASVAPQPDRNILSNLGEVRKIMQHDHIEMLQQLLDLHIK